MALFIINTNLQKDTRYEREMLEEKKCAAYRSTKTDIQNIQKNDRVLLYTNKKGIIARGVASGALFMKEDNGEPNAEYYMRLINFTELIIPIPPHKLKNILLLADPQEARPFNKTSLKFREAVSEKIWREICRYM
ncbi:MULTISPECIES: hypothetical protein [Bacillus cereus group]|uniref:hypothetical protein n=1 Tax=Bacillus cereus group TaxID=86661 RepID=UPI0012384A52|nr:hypothetical protein [Bacillus cereus]KAA6461555.1 hypothetical protein DX930_24125 [Bacillus cereus]KAB2414255.1 hypothetical protein F8169_28365 [Bacillus cereus]KAB2436048.1 hypothetical protein F8166_13945 [Bacillus cereus]KAB2464071.1 hypothetical protein F8164_19945 [Bacillus cereus]